MKKCLLTAAALLAAAVFSHAQEIRDIETTVNLFRNGNAQVIQKWDVTVVSGTEYYIPIDNPGKSYIHDFKVFENGREYANEGRDWDSDRSREEKAGRCGIVEKGKGNIEICWGLGEYGDHVYTIAYIIDNLVQSYPECDGFHWHFLNDEWSVRPEHVSIRLVNETEGDTWYWASADSCNVRFWGFGLEGESGMTEQGNILFESTAPLAYNSFFSALVQFDKGLFEPRMHGDGTFEELKEEAMKGSDYGEEKDGFWDYVFYVFFAIIFIGVPIFLLGWLIFKGIQRIYRRVTGNRYRKEVFEQTKITTWNRDVPFDANPCVLYSLLQSGDIFHQNKNAAFSNVVGAYFLKWIQEGLVKVEKDPRKEDRVNLRFVKPQEEEISFTDKMEATIYESAREAAGDDVLEANEFKSWSYKHDITVSSWPNEAISSGRNVWKAVSPEMRRKAVEFKNFLEDFTLVDERSVPELGLWKQYMIMAAGLGIADKVAKNFEKLFPQVMEQYTRETNMLDTMTSYQVLNSLNRSSSSMMKAAETRQSERAAARAAAARRSSGGGGSISFGGGGGGFGGGHGGGTR